MIDFANIEKYKENNRIEAKRATGGLPRSIWETYSAFANTLGGILLLGVEEHADKSLHPAHLSDPEGLIKEFWVAVNNPKRASVNILSEKDVTIENVDGERIVAIRVPRAQRSDKPVYIDGNPFSGSYRRSGEGDYRCTREEVEAMMRDAELRTQDMALLENVGLDAFDCDSVKRYRARMKACRPENVWEELDDTEFLYKLGAIGRSDDGKLHPTAAGLLMLGCEREIVKAFPTYFLEYQEPSTSDTGRTDRIVSSSGDWSGNVYDFYCRVCGKITQDVEMPLGGEGDECRDGTPVQKVLLEALANCLINADYYGREGVVILKKKNEITFSNPGSFRIDVEAAKSGGVSDPRNGMLVRMFGLIDVGKRTGSGIPSIFGVWRKQGWSAPVIHESFEPDRITLSLAIGRSDDKKEETSGDTETRIKSQIQKQAIVAYLTERIAAEALEVADLLGVKAVEANRLLSEMVVEGTVVAESEKESAVYKLKA